MVEASREARARIDEFRRLAADTDQVAMVLGDAERGLDNPADLTLLEVQRVCFALVAAYAGRRHDDN